MAEKMAMSKSIDMTTVNVPSSLVRREYTIATDCLGFGSGTLLQALLDNQDENYAVVLVVSDRECPALDRARAAGWKLLLCRCSTTAPTGTSS